MVATATSIGAVPRLTTVPFTVSFAPERAARAAPSATAPLELTASEADDRAAMDRRVAANIRGPEQWLRDNIAAPPRTRAHG